MIYIVSFDTDKDYWLGQFVSYQDLYVIEWSGWNYSKTFNPYTFSVLLAFLTTNPQQLMMLLQILITTGNKVT